MDIAARNGESTSTIAGRTLFGADTGEPCGELGDDAGDRHQLAGGGRPAARSSGRSFFRCLTRDDSAPRGRRLIARFPASSKDGVALGVMTGDLLSLLLVGTRRGGGEVMSDASSR